MKNSFLVVCLMSLSNISVVNAEFKLDISISDLDKSLEIISINDLAVGESAYINLTSFCTKSDGNIAVSRVTRIQSERSDYSAYALIKIQPGGTISVELIPSKKLPEENSKKMVLKKFLGSIREFFSCDVIKTVLPLHNAAVYPVSTIEGMQSAKKLLEMYLKMK
jgi:hypothetical protein